MVALLIFVSLLLVVSGVVKVKAAERVELGLPLMPLVELVAGIGIFSQVFIREFSARQGMIVVVGAVLLVIASSIQVGMAVRRKHRLRTSSEGTRLANYVKYLSRDDPSSK